MKGRAEQFLGVVLALVLLGTLTAKVSSRPNDLPEKRSTQQVQCLHTSQPRLEQNYGKLPLSFELNQGQTDARVRFQARGRGYTISLTDGEAVLSLRKSLPGMSELGKFGPPGRLEPLGPVNPRGGRWPSLADELKSLWPSLLPDLGQLVPDPSAGKDAVVVELESQPPQVMRMRLVGGNAKGRVVGLDQLPGRSNYFLGNDPKKWRTNVPSYTRVKYEGVYPGVDLVYYGNQRQLEYDFVVEPGADPNQIKLSFAGADGMRVDAASGDLVLKLGNNEVRFRKPAVYQPTVAAGNDRRRRSESAATAQLGATFVLASNNQVAFRVAGYDPQRALVIDPVLSYSTYLGGTYQDIGYGIAVDSSGNAYVIGVTSSTNFPTVNPLQAALEGSQDVFVTKFNADGSALIYSTYLGGSGVGQYGYGITVDSTGNAYVTGQTNSTDFPTVNPVQATNHGGTCGIAPRTYTCSNVFVTKFNPAGSALIYSTYLGGSGGDSGIGIAADSSGNAYVAGQTYSTDFPTVNPVQATNHGGTCGISPKTYTCPTVFVTKFNPAGSALVYSTYLGGSAGDGARGIAADSSGSVYLTGWTSSTDFPTSNPFQATNKAEVAIPGNYTVFVAKLNAAGSALVYSTYLGGSTSDFGFGIAADSSGNAYLTGYTQSTDFPTANPLQGTCASCSANSTDAFVAKLNPAGSALVYSTYLGGSSLDYGYGIAVDTAGSADVTGYTESTDFPTANPIQATNNALYATVFVAKLNAAGSAFVYSTYLGGSDDNEAYGIAVDSSGNAYVTGETEATDFPTANPFQATCGTCSGGHSTAFVAKISLIPGATLSTNSLSFAGQMVNTSSAEKSVTLTNNGDGVLSVTSIAATGDFAETNTCGNSVAAGANCAINVTFTPMASGNRTGTLSINDNAAGSPQTVTLTGMGEDFTLAPSGSSTSATVAPGSTATYTLSVGGEGGLTDTVNFTCLGAPSEATCTAPNSVTLGSSPTNVTVTVSTTAPSVSAPRSRHLPPIPPLLPGLGGLLMLVLALAAVAWAIMRRKQLGWSLRQCTLVPFAAGLLLTLALAGCGGGGGGAPATTPSSPGTPAGTYTLTVTGTAGSGTSTLSHSVMLTLIVS